MGVVQPLQPFRISPSAYFVPRKTKVFCGSCSRQFFDIRGKLKYGLRRRGSYAPGGERIIRGKGKAADFSSAFAPLIQANDPV